MLRICSLAVGLIAAGSMPTIAQSPAQPTSSTSQSQPTPTSPAARGAEPTRSQGQQGSGQEVNVTGCLTANIDGRSYALTPADQSGRAGELGRTTTRVRPTFTYELVGKAEEFRSHANKVVTARGRVDASAQKEAAVSTTTESSAKPATGSGGTPTVEVKEQAQIEVRRLHVTSLSSEGAPCPSIGGQSPR
ncbi:MAG: hypothetical protein H0V80_15715 [Acidobacteria bacterium]|nr:hypothetical protein [Acidobacteriota bacterium]